MIELISPKKNQYKANLHSHSTLSDGKCTPEELKEMYKSRGYSALAITDHELPYDHSDMTDSDFLMITGYESHIRPSESAVYDPFSCEVHMNFFARDPHNITTVDYSKPYARYVDAARAYEDIPKVGVEGPREYTPEYINRHIAAAREAGYIVSYNHPVWSMEDESDLLAYRGFFSMEICNANARMLNGIEYNAALYDRLLCRGRRIFCHGSDDNHNKFPIGHPNSDSFGAATVILADALNYESVFAALEKGDFYATEGPRIKSMKVEGDLLTVECSPAACVIFYFGSKQPRRLYAPSCRPLTRALFEIPKKARYIRVCVRDERGLSADSRGFFPDEFREVKAEDYGE